MQESTVARQRRRFRSMKGSGQGSEFFVVGKPIFLKKASSGKKVFAHGRDEKIKNGTRVRDEQKKFSDQTGSMRILFCEMFTVRRLYRKTKARMARVRIACYNA